MIENISKMQCTGCKMCGDLCPEKAISFQEDKEGFYYPKVDSKRCSLCGICVEKCVGISAYSSNRYKLPEVYAAWQKDIKMRRYSTSGGVYYALAKKIFDEDGSIVACRFTKDLKHAEHIVVENEDMLLDTVTSKYFQSDTAGIYQKVKALLERGKRVLFCGTPCQSVALQKFLTKEYRNLITMDFICRGINSPKAYGMFIKELEEKYQSAVKSVHFKHKKEGWKSLGILVKFENGLEHFETKDNSYWTMGYIRDNLYMRPVCHECQYRKIPRCSDFTVGDFWGIQNVNEKEMFNGISVLFANSDFAKSFICELDNIELEKRTLEEALGGNPCILSSPQKGKQRGKFFELLNEVSFSKAVEQCCGDYNQNDAETI